MRHVGTVSMVLMVLLGVEGAALAAGWTQPAGGWYLKVWNRTLVGSRAYMADGSGADLGRSYQDHALNYHFEYGLTDDWTLVTSGRPLGWAKFGDESAFYMSDLRLGVRRALLRGGVNIAAEARYGFAPDVGAKSLGEGTAAGQVFFYAPTIATHTLEAELQLGTGFSWGYFSTTAGFRWYSADDVDPVVYANAVLGYLADFGLGFDFYVTVHQPLGDVVVTNVSGAGQTRFLGFGIDFSYWFDPHWSINLGLAGVAFAESNAATPAFTLGFAAAGAPD